MSKFKNAKNIGLRDKATDEIIAVYPKKPEGTDSEIEKCVKDWYYTTSCAAENILLNAYVDIVSDKELK